MKKIAVLGYGVVGSGVVELFYRNVPKLRRTPRLNWTLPIFSTCGNFRMTLTETVWYTTSRPFWTIRRSAMLPSAWAV